MTTELSTVGHSISECQWEGISFSLKLSTTTGWSEEQSEVVRFIFNFFLVLRIQLWKYFHSTVLGSVGSDYYEKIGC